MSFSHVSSVGVVFGTEEFRPSIDVVGVSFASTVIVRFV